MRILVFVRDFAAQTLTFVYNEVRRLSVDHEVLILTNHRLNQDQFPFPQVSECRFIRQPWMDKQVRRLQDRNRRWAFVSRRVRRWIQDEISAFRPDVIHGHFGGESWILLANWPPSEIPVLISFHGYDASKKLQEPAYVSQCRTFLRRPDVSPIFASDYMWRKMESAVGEVGTGHVLYYGTDTGFFRRDVPLASRDSPVRVFLQISSFTEKKGHAYTLRAFARLQNDVPQGRQVRLVLAGDGPLKASMEELATTLGLESVVDFPGMVTPEEARDLLMKADVFVHHSVTSATDGDQEGIPNAIMEAMAMELPVLSTVHAGIPELVEDGVNGILVEERDVGAAAEGMLAILDWPMLAINREKVIRLFEKESHYRNLVQIYQQANSGTGAGVTVQP